MEVGAKLSMSGRFFDIPDAVLSEDAHTFPFAHLDSGASFPPDRDNLRSEIRWDTRPVLAILAIPWKETFSAQSQS